VQASKTAEPAELRRTSPRSQVLPADRYREFDSHLVDRQPKHVGRDLPEYRIGAGADIVMEVFTVTTPSRSRETLAFAASIGLPRIAADIPCDEPLAVSHLFRALDCGSPTENFRSLLHARTSVRVEKGTFISGLHLVRCGYVTRSVHIQSDREFVHRAFQRQQSNGFAWRSHGGGNRQIERRKAMLRQTVRRRRCCASRWPPFRKSLPGVLLE